MTPEELLRPGAQAQHRYTGETFEVRKVRDSGEVVIKIARGDHFNTYTVKRENVVPVGSPVEDKPVGLPRTSGGGTKAKTKPPERVVKHFEADPKKGSTSFVYRVEYRHAGKLDELPVLRQMLEVAVDPKCKLLASDYDPASFGPPHGPVLGPVESEDEAGQLAVIATYARIEYRMELGSLEKADWRLVGSPVEVA